ncbi:uncharacterized protein LOC142178211 [Nicotiana tabacum]|uniref:Uncharacterized protein LOC142178211 n=1 Tax=Nicotiana tabacum TaxID=4097 RepID=A0AC58U2C3_TOBAC
MGQIENLLSERTPGTLPSDTEKNPKETIKVISLRSGKALTGSEVKARPEVISKHIERPEEKVSEEQNNQSSGAQKEIEESRHMSAPPFPQKMKREKLDKCFGKFLELLKQLYVNIPFKDVLTQMPDYAKFLKEILSSKRKLEETTLVKLNTHCNAILQNRIPQKCVDLGSFTIPCSLGNETFDKALCDSGASINLLPLSIFRKLEGTHEQKLVELLKKHRKAMRWSVTDIQGISPAISMNKILLEENSKPVVQPQHKLNKNLVEWISPVQVVPKKGGMTVVKHEDNEVILTRIVTGWKTCIDYRMLNDATRKDHFPLPFIDQMPKKVAGHGCYCFLVEIREEFPDEQIFAIAAVSKRPPWYADIANVLASGWLPHYLSCDQRRKLQGEVKGYFWNDPFLFKLCGNGVIRRCVREGEMASVLSHCHDGAAGGHYGRNSKTENVMEAGFFWPTLYKDASAYVAACDKCQRAGNISKRDEMTNDARVVCAFLRKNIFTDFGTPRVIISDNGSHFVNKQFAALLTNASHKDWSVKLEEALWAYRTAFKTTIGTSPFKLVYGKSYHLPVEIEHKAYWPIRMLNLDLSLAGDTGGGLVSLWRQTI